MSFTKRGAEAQPVAPPALAAPASTCPLCGTANDRGVRFCVTCGQHLADTVEGGSSRLGAIDLSRTVADATPKATPLHVSGGVAPFIEPARVIDVGSTIPPQRQSACPRCKGARESGAQFCRFCGLPFAATPPSAAAQGLPAPAVRASAVPKLASIVLITRDGGEGPTYPLGGSTDLGRTEGSILFPDDQFVSPRHARIVTRGAEFFVRDLESTNGVYVRIPFPAREREDAGDGKDDKTTIRGNHSEPLAGAADAVKEQPLADQDLFLVGQQVLRFEVVKQAEEAFGAASENGTLLFGTPAAPRYARLSQRTVEGLVRDVFHVRRAETVIGRESGDIVFTDDPFLSRRHAVLRMQGGGGSLKKRFTLADLGSSNGTFLRIRDEVRLRSGDHFRIGQQLLRFDIDAAHAGV